MLDERRREKIDPKLLEQSKKLDRQKTADLTAKTKIVLKLTNNPEMTWATAEAIAKILTHSKDSKYSKEGVTKAALEKEFNYFKRAVNELREYKKLTAPKSKTRGLYYKVTKPKKPKTYSEQLAQREENNLMETRLAKSLVGRSKVKHPDSYYLAVAGILKQKPHAIIPINSRNLTHKGFMDALHRRQRLRQRIKATHAAANVARELKRRRIK